uniref:Malic enzyme N-terminal domain-containing protein n=1 Tax=Peromyscus maniculatus bairdii TaxID=230844 RepID=A0A8C8UAP5_PERMB
HQHLLKNVSHTHTHTHTHTHQHGYLLTRPHLNKNLAFTLEERQQLNIHGLLPPSFISQEIHVLRVVKSFECLNSDFDRYLLLMDLQDRNEKLFYSVLMSDIEKFMPIVYTPTVGLACQQYSLAFRKPR